VSNGGPEVASRHQCRRAADDDVRTFVEIGPGKVLLGLIRAVDKSVAAFNVEDEKSLENAFSGLL
jgi:[acyl-carrier-protein] S-malonyltransferase